MAEGRSIVWKLPLYNTVHNILTNPVYAGAYAFGRTTSKVSIEDGRKRVRRGLRRPSAEWDVLLKDQHEGYITWDEFERNQRVIADNATGKGSAIARGRGAARGAASRRASALWPLRPQDVCGLWRQGRALSLLGRAREPWHRALHLVRRLARRCMPSARRFCGS